MTKEQIESTAFRVLNNKHSEDKLQPEQFGYYTMGVLEVASWLCYNSMMNDRLNTAKENRQE